METIINIKGIKFEVGFDYQPYEATVMYYSDGTGHKGCSESIDGIWKLEHEGNDWFDIFEQGDNMKLVEDAIWQKRADDLNSDLI